MTKLGWNSLGHSFDCPCGETHTVPVEACRVGEDAAQALAAFAQQRCGKTCLVVSDENTRAAGGDALFKALGGGSRVIREKVYPGQALEATGEEAEKVAVAGDGVDFYVGLGSGTVCDLAKYAGHTTGKPVLLFATAASMNGYTSGIAALKVRGLKRTLPCRAAAGVFADPAIAATAPSRMAAAGVADYLSKCSSSADWRAAHLIRGDYYCDRPREFFEGTTAQMLDAAYKVASGDISAMTTVLEGLMLSGLSMVVAGSSAPASGGEHLLSHFLDMKHALYGTAHDLHGAQVGVGTVYCLELWEKLIAADFSGADVRALIEAQPAEEAIAAWIHEDWGDAVGAEVLAQWKQKTLDRAGLEAEITKFIRLQPHVSESVQRDLLPAAAVADAIRAAGGPVVPEELEADTQEYYRAQKMARFLRNRFTVLDLAAEMGLA